jgi:hypothetical protein
MNGLLDPQPRRFGQPTQRTINLLPSHPPHPNRHRLTALELIAHADTLSVADNWRSCNQLRSGEADRTVGKNRDQPDDLRGPASRRMSDSG